MYSTSRDSAKVASDWRNPRSNRCVFFKVRTWNSHYTGIDINNLILENRFKKLKKRHLGFEYANQVQAKCASMMSLFGYEQLDTAAKNFNLSLPSTKPLDQYNYLFQFEHWKTDALIWHNKCA